VDVIEFLAALPPIKSALLIDGMGDGGQVKLEVGRESRAALLALGEWAGKRLRVRVTLDDEDDDGLGHPIGRRQAKKRIPAGDPGL